jgi:hypothetical protein
VTKLQNAPTLVLKPQQSLSAKHTPPKSDKPAQLPGKVAKLQVTPLPVPQHWPLSVHASSKTVQFPAAGQVAPPQH